MGNGEATNSAEARSTESKALVRRKRAKGEEQLAEQKEARAIVLPLVNEVVMLELELSGEYHRQGRQALAEFHQAVAEKYLDLRGFILKKLGHRERPRPLG